jgi:sulfatase modifying factor 1
LPTEAEWEYACRAGKVTPFTFGETISTDQANFDGTRMPYGGTTKGVFRRTTTPVGMFKANGWGVFDMHGNALEWCADRYGPYPNEAVADPTGARTGVDWVLRGGSWFGAPTDLRSGNRTRGGAGADDMCGFRLAASLVER